MISRYEIMSFVISYLLFSLAGFLLAIFHWQDYHWQVFMSDVCFHRLSLDIADEHVSLTVQDPETIRRLDAFIRDCVPASSAGPYQSVIKANQKVCNIPFSEAEFYTCILIVSDLLLPDACIFHGTAFIWKGLAYILTAPSGTGKTTQFLNWSCLYGDEVRIINGDKPALRVFDDQTVTVYPTPWNGKEDLRGDQSARLGGIICLEQAACNAIHRCTVKEAVPLLFPQVFSLAEDEKSVHTIGSFVEKLLHAAPVWLLSNKGDLDSARLTQETILAYRGKMTGV